jgi:hypothetical protein
LSYRFSSANLTIFPDANPPHPAASEQLLFDFDFKREFTRVFIRVYEDFMKTILLLQEHKEIPTRMVDISVQLFSNSVLTVSMIREVFNSIQFNWIWLHHRPQHTREFFLLVQPHEFD